MSLISCAKLHFFIRKQKSLCLISHNDFCIRDVPLARMINPLLTQKTPEYIYPGIFVILLEFNVYAVLALKAMAYILICFTMASRPLLRVGDRCSPRPMSSMK